MLIRILFVSTWSSPVVYDLYSFFHSLPGVTLFPCSFGYGINERVFLKCLENSARSRLKLPVSAESINTLCDELEIDLVVITWLLEIQELKYIIGEIRRRVLLFPHGQSPILQKLGRFGNCVLFHDQSCADSQVNQHRFTFYMSRGFVNQNKEMSHDGSMIFAGWSNLRMGFQEKRFFLDLIFRHLQSYRVTILKMMLFTMTPERMISVSRLVRKAFHRIIPMVKDFSSTFKDRINLESKHHEIQCIMNHPGANLIQFIPYNDLASEISRHSLVEATPTMFVTHLPARAACALASGTPLLLKKGTSPFLESILRKFNNGLIYSKYEDIAQLISCPPRWEKISTQAITHRHRFVMENQSEEIVEILRTL